MVPESPPENPTAAQFRELAQRCRYLASISPDPEQSAELSWLAAELTARADELDKQSSDDAELAIEPPARS